MAGFVRTRDEAIDAIDRSLSRWCLSAAEEMGAAHAGLQRAAEEIDRAVGRRRARIAQIEEALRSLPEDADPSPLVAALARAQESLNAALRSRSEVSACQESFRALQSRFQRSTSSHVPRAQARLRELSGAIEEYRSASSGGFSSGAGGSSSSSPMSLTVKSDPLEKAGMREVSVSEMDFSDNPILDNYNRSGLSKADYRWAVETWANVVGPGNQRGLTRDDFERRDQQRGARPPRSTAEVYDLFLGESHRIVLSRRADGRLEVNNGRHRIQVARELGISSLPCRVFE